MKHGFGLFEVDDVNTIAHAKNVRRHFGVPSPGVMAEMNASFEQLAHARVRNRHCQSFSPVGPPQEKSVLRKSRRCRHRSGRCKRRRPPPCVRYREITYGARAPKTSPAHPFAMRKSELAVILHSLHRGSLNDTSCLMNRWF